MMQSFGLIFRDRFAELGINSSQTTTIININFAVTSCTGKLFYLPIIYQLFVFRTDFSLTYSIIFLTLFHH